MKSAYRAIAILGAILIVAGIVSTIIAIAVAGSVGGLLHQSDIWWDGTHIRIPHIHIDGANVHVGDKDSGIDIDDSHIRIGEPDSGINITFD